MSSTLLPDIGVVRAKRKEASGIFTLTVESPRHGELPDGPGQFCMLYAFGKGEVPISMSGDPANLKKREFTIQAVGAVTRALVDLKPGESLGVRGPYGSSWPLDRAVGKDVLVMAGGLGLAPLRSLITGICRRRREFGSVSVLYGTRRPSDILFEKDHERWREDYDINLLMTVDVGTPGWIGAIGVVTRLLRYSQVIPSRTVAYVCGPEIMMRISAEELVDRGFNPADVFVSLERNMKCGVGLCGRCQLQGDFICTDGPVFDYGGVREVLAVHEV